jgi:hypothetical protein
VGPKIWVKKNWKNWTIFDGGNSPLLKGEEGKEEKGSQSVDEGTFI